MASVITAKLVKETQERLEAVKATLPFHVESSPGGFHVWLKVPEPWTRGELVSRLRSTGIGIITSDAFAIASAPEAVRLALGAPANLEELTRALQIMSDLLSQQPAFSTMVV